MTNEKGKNRKERANTKYYEDIRNQPYAVFVKLCDRLANVTYGKMVGGRMVEMYRREQHDFITALAGDQLDKLQPMVDELERLFI